MINYERFPHLDRENILFNHKCSQQMLYSAVTAGVLIWISISPSMNVRVAIYSNSTINHSNVSLNTVSQQFHYSLLLCNRSISHKINKINFKNA